MMVTRHKKLEQVNIHHRKLFDILISIIGIRETSSVIFTNFVCVLRHDVFSQAYFVTRRTCYMHPSYRMKNYGEGVLTYEITLGVFLKCFTAFFRVRRSATNKFLAKNSAKVHVGSYLLSMNCITTQA